MSTKSNFERWIPAIPLLALLIVLAAVAIWFFSGMSNSEVAKDNAVAEAANDVGDAGVEVAGSVYPILEVIGVFAASARVPDVLFTQIIPAVSRARSSRSPPSTK